MNIAHQPILEINFVDGGLRAYMQATPFAARPTDAKPARKTLGPGSKRLRQPAPRAARPHLPLELRSAPPGRPLLKGLNP
jgi:hypothetical protein